MKIDTTESYRVPKLRNSVEFASDNSQREFNHGKIIEFETRWDLRFASNIEDGNLCLCIAENLRT